MIPGITNTQAYQVHQEHYSVSILGSQQAELPRETSSCELALVEPCSQAGKFLLKSFHPTRQGRAWGSLTADKHAW